MLPRCIQCFSIAMISNRNTISWCYAPLDAAKERTPEPINADHERPTDHHSRAHVSPWVHQPARLNRGSGGGVGARRKGVGGINVVDADRGSLSWPPLLGVRLVSGGGGAGVSTLMGPGVFAGRGKLAAVATTTARWYTPTARHNGRPVAARKGLSPSTSPPSPLAPYLSLLSRPAPAALGRCT